MVSQDDEGYWDYSVLHRRWSFLPGQWLLWVLERPPVCYPCTVITSISKENEEPHSWHPIGAKPWVTTSPTITDESGLLATLGRPKQNVRVTTKYQALVQIWSFPSKLDQHSLHSLSICWWGEVMPVGFEKHMPWCRRNQQRWSSGVSTSDIFHRICW